MLKQLRRPAPGLVIAIIALFVALGGTVYAAGKISGKSIKVKSLPGNRLKPNSVTGKQVKESSLGQVPLATTANTASRATLADNASKVNGHTAGCATGTQLFAGACWESAPRAAATAAVAAETCAESGGTLPHAAELLAFSKKVTLGGTDEWTGDFNEVKSANVYTVITVSKAGVVNIDNPIDNKEYRCVLPLVQ